MDCFLESCYELTKKDNRLNSNTTFSKSPDLLKKTIFILFKDQEIGNVSTSKKLNYVT